jgi:hypothetical protein
MFFVLTSKVRPRWSIANFSDETKAEMRQIILVLQLRHWVSDTLGSQHHDRSEHEGGLCPDSLENYWTYEWMGRKKLLSCAARETLIKSVAQSIPTSSMSCFLLSPDTCRKITSAISNYWWSSNVDQRGLHWRRWQDLALPKYVGGMGFCDIKQFNIAMLGKQGWRLMTNPDSLCAQVLKGKYFPNGEFLTRKKKHSSHTWRAILAGRRALELGLIKRIGNGADTNIWDDRRLPGGVSNKVLCKPEHVVARTVKELISWRWSKLGCGSGTS